MENKLSISRCMTCKKYLFCRNLQFENIMNMQIHKFSHKEEFFVHKDNCIDVGCRAVNNNTKSDLVSNFSWMIMNVGSF